MKVITEVTKGILDRPIGRLIYDTDHPPFRDVEVDALYRLWREGEYRGGDDDGG